MAKFQTPMICNKQATDTRVAVNYRLGDSGVAREVAAAEVGYKPEFF
jgi:hypothetical protein